MASKTELIEMLDRATAVWNQAEEIIKQAEYVNEGNVVMPSVNELRYAGRKCVDVLSIFLKSNDKPSEKELKEAQSLVASIEQYAYNAKHDSVDAMASGLKGELADLCTDFGYPIVMSYVNIQQMREKVEAIAGEFSKSRKDRAYREPIYDKVIEEHVTSLLVYKTTITQNLDNIRNAWVKQKKNKRKDKILKTAMFLMAFTALSHTVYHAVQHDLNIDSNTQQQVDSGAN